MFGAMSWQEGERSQPVLMESVSSLRSKVSQTMESLGGEGPQHGDVSQRSW